MNRHKKQKMGISGNCDQSGNMINVFVIIYAPPPYPRSSHNGSSPSDTHSTCMIGGADALCRVHTLFVWFWNQTRNFSTKYRTMEVDGNFTKPHWLTLDSRQIFRSGACPMCCRFLPLISSIANNGWNLQPNWHQKTQRNLHVTPADFQAGST